jgi:hypothetical protein
MRPQLSWYPPRVQVSENDIMLKPRIDELAKRNKTFKVGVGGGGPG